MDKSKRKLKIKKIVSAIVAVVLIIVIATSIVIPLINYSSGVKKMNVGNYADAAEAFAKAARLKDSVQLLSECTAEILKDANVGDVVYFGYYHDGVIPWTVIDSKGSGRLIVSNEIVYHRPYNNQDGSIYEDTDAYDYNLWSNCSLRTWLNTSFYEEAFDKVGQNIICTTNVVNSVKLEFTKEGGKDTEDKVFILSWGEAKDYLCKYDIDILEEDYWLRSPSGTDGYKASISPESSSGWVIGDKQSKFLTKTSGVRPAMWVDASDSSKQYTVKSDTDLDDGISYRPSGSSGKCSRCNGTGSVRYNYGSSDLEAYLSGHDPYTYGTCGSCGGTGRS